MTAVAPRTKQRARHSANEQAACSLTGSIEQLVKIIILNRRSSMAERCRCVRCTITELSKQREAAQVKIMIEWCDLRRPLQCAGTTWNDVVELSCCAIGIALSSLASPDSTSATVKFSTVSAGEFATSSRPPLPRPPRRHSLDRVCFRGVE